MLHGVRATELGQVLHTDRSRALQAALDAAFGSENHVTVFLEPGKQQNIMLADEEVMNGLAMQPQQPPRSARPPSAIRRPRSARGRAPLAQQP